MLEATKDLQSVTADGQVVDSGLIDGVRLRPARSVLTRSGSLIEVFRSNWPDVSVRPGQVNWVTLWPEGVSDWHRHLAQTDHIFPVLGAVRLSLHDDRDDSPTRGLSNVFRIGALAPMLVIVPPGVWHGFRNECGELAAYLNYFEKPYCHEDPDNWRLPADTVEIPCRL